MDDKTRDRMLQEYGDGFFDGFRAAQKLRRMEMKAEQAGKTLSVDPLDEWDKHDVLVASEDAENDHAKQFGKKTKRKLAKWLLMKEVFAKASDMILSAGILFIIITAVQILAETYPILFNF